TSAELGAVAASSNASARSLHSIIGPMALRMANRLARLSTAYSRAQATRARGFRRTRRKPSNAASLAENAIFPLLNWPAPNLVGDRSRVSGIRLLIAPRRRKGGFGG